MSSRKRGTDSYLASVKKLAAFAPALKKYKRRKALNQWEKAAISRKENVLKFAFNLQPVSKKQARQLKDQLFRYQTIIKSGPNKGRHIEHGGIRAIQLSNTGEKVSIKVINKNMFVTTNGRTWVYWRLREQLAEFAYEMENEDTGEVENFATPEQQKIMIDSGTQSFQPSIRDAFPVEKIIRLAEKAFKNPTAKMIGLYTGQGRVGEGFRNLKEFIRWVYEDFSRYQNVERWVHGIAILIADVGEEIPFHVWSNKNHAKILSERKARRKQNRKRRG